MADTPASVPGGLADYKAFYLGRFQEPTRCDVTAVQGDQRCPEVAKYLLTTANPIRDDRAHVCDLCLAVAVRAMSKRRIVTVQRLPENAPSGGAG